MTPTNNQPGEIDLAEKIAALPRPDLRYHDEYRRGYSSALSDASALARSAPPAGDGGEERALMNEIELYFEANANVSDECAGFLDRLVKARAAHPIGHAGATVAAGWTKLPTEPGMYWRCDPVNCADIPPSVVEVVVSPGGPLCTVAHNAPLGFGFKGDVFYDIEANDCNLWMKIDQPVTPPRIKKPVAFSCKKRADAGASAWSQTCDSHCGNADTCPASKAPTNN